MLGEATSAEDAVSRSKARKIVTVEPEMTVRNGERVLVLPPDAGYGPVVELMSRAM